LHNKSDILKKSSTILLATVLVVGLIGISTQSSIFAQYYDDDYESEEYSQYYDDYETKYYNYESYMKDDNSKPSIQKLSCNNIINNLPVDNNVDTNNAFDSPTRDSQSGQDRMNADRYSDQKGNFVYVCQNNNVDIQNTFNNGDNSFSFVHNNTLQQNQNASFTTSMVCGNTFSEGDNSNITTIMLGNNITCLLTQNVTQIGNITDNTQNNPPGVISTSSIADVEQPLTKTQQIKSFENDNGIEIQQQRTEDSTELTAMEKITKLKAQYVELYQ
jgi:hypothetical protein